MSVEAPVAGISACEDAPAPRRRSPVRRRLALVVVPVGIALLAAAAVAVSFSVSAPGGGRARPVAAAARAPLGSACATWAGVARSAAAPSAAELADALSRMRPFVDEAARADGRFVGAADGVTFLHAVATLPEAARQAQDPALVQDAAAVVDDACAALG